MMKLRKLLTPCIFFSPFWLESYLISNDLSNSSPMYIFMRSSEIGTKCISNIINQKNHQKISEIQVILHKALDKKIGTYIIAKLNLTCSTYHIHLPFILCVCECVLCSSILTYLLVIKCILITSNCITFVFLSYMPFL